MRARATRTQAPPAARRERPLAVASHPPAPAGDAMKVAGRRQMEARRLEVRRRLGVMTAGEGERLGALRRQMEAHWASARQRARRQPDVLRALRADPGAAGPHRGGATPLHGAPSELRLPASPPAHLLRAPGGGATPGGRFLVEDSEVPGPGQVRKGVFLRYLRQQVSAMADEALAALGQSADDCPYIRKWFGYYGGQDVAHVETSIRRYAPDAAAAGDWREVARRVVERARRAFELHVETGSLDGAPDDVEVEPAELAPRPTAPASGEAQAPSLQRCCGGEAESEGERGRLIRDSSSPIFDIQPMEFKVGPDLPEPGEQADLSGWHQESRPLKDRWTVYTRIDGKWILAIATTGTGRVVANSSLEHTGVKFTSFGSNPPFSGLGSVVLDKLVERVEGASSRAQLYPSSPVPGSLTFYTRMGMTGALKDQGLKIPSENVQGIISRGVREQLGEIVDFDLEDSEVRKRLQAVQKWVVETEQRRLY